MKKIIFLLTFLCLAVHAFPQKTLLTFPFEFEKSFLQKSDYSAYFLDNQKDECFAFILRDNKKVSYAMADKKFKVVSQFQKKLDETVFSHDEQIYLGGTADKNTYRYIYKVMDKKLLSTNILYMEETVDFDAKTINTKQVFEIPKEEQMLASFCDHNRYFTITINKKTGDLQFYEILASGEAVTKSVHFKAPSEKINNDELIGFFTGLRVIREGEEPGLNVATRKAKLYCYTDRLDFVFNTEAASTYIFSVDLNDYSSTQKFVDHTILEEKETKAKSYVSSFLKDQRLFTLVINKKNIVIAVYNQQDGSLVEKTVLNEDNYLTLMAEPPVRISKTGGGTSQEDLSNFGKLLYRLKLEQEGLAVSTNKTGQYVLQVGTFEPFAAGSTGGGSWNGGGYERTPGFTAANPSGQATYQFVAPTFMPGFSSYTSSKYYFSTYFKMLLDPKTFKPARGRVSPSISEQIRDYQSGTDKKTAAVRQFNMGKKQYLGYYDKDQVAYIIEEIMIRK